MLVAAYRGIEVGERFRGGDQAGAVAAPTTAAELVMTGPRRELPDEPGRRPPGPAVHPTGPPTEPPTEPPAAGTGPAPRDGWWSRVPGVRRFGLGAVVAAVLVVMETVFLVTAGGPVWSSSPDFVTTTPAVAQLQRTVGDSLVGFGGTRVCLNLGLSPDVNLMYGLHELNFYDPVAPKEYFTSWKADNGQIGGLELLNTFCPIIKSATEARRYGVSYVLEPSGSSGPTGGVFVERIADEELYRVPGVSAATLVGAQRSGAPAGRHAGSLLRCSIRGTRPAVDTNATQESVVRVRLTNVPGWHATVDGRAVALLDYGGFMVGVSPRAATMSCCTTSPRRSPGAWSWPRSAW